ncbi:MAG: dihydroorotase [Cellvibrionaceae bacterium]|nr:dihydroorotase [Cellvibrionaceae bacterium]
MTKATLLKNALVINQGNCIEADLLIKGDKINKIAGGISANNNYRIIDLQGKTLLPGMIDDQVHFREPGLTHKGTIASESRAAVAGGISSFMEMPNVDPSTTSIAALESKFELAKHNSFGNYSFYLGATEDNLDEIKALDPKSHCGLKVFMGASTGDLLVEDSAKLEAIFRECPSLIVTHCEDGKTIAKNLRAYQEIGLKPSILDHPKIRDTEACYRSSSLAVALAKKHQSQLHVLHISSEKELELFDSGPIDNKHITAEACVHHLWFSEDDYPRRGNLIKCNPAIKKASDRSALLNAVRNGTIDIIATDHAPHTWREKQQPYLAAPAGLPLVQHALLSLLDHVNNGILSLFDVVEKTAHNPARRYQIDRRGFIKEGYFADLVAVDFENNTITRHDNNYYHCQWTPFQGHRFSSKISSTWVNGQQVFDGNKIISDPCAQRLAFNK